MNSKRFKPEQIAFFVRLNESLTELGANQTIPFDDIVLNESHCFKSDIHVFICPINGVYMFQVAGMAGINEHTELDLMINGSVLFGVHTSGTGCNTEYCQGFNAGVVQCEKGQAVWVKIRDEFGTTVNNKHFTTFSGFLLWKTDEEKLDSRVAFNTFLTPDVSLSNADTVPFNNVTLNQQHGFDSTSHIFTCPVNGVYLFESALTADGHGQVETDIMQDGVPIVRMHAAVSTPDIQHKKHGQGFNSGITKCKKGQQIFVKTHQGNDVLQYKLTTFSGFLIWETEQDLNSTCQADEGSGKIAFHASLSTSVTKLGRQQTIPFDTVSLNVGQAYNTFFHAFTCPIDGVYMFRSALMSEQNSYIETEVVQNGTPLFRVLASSSTTSNSDQGFNAGIVKCYKGQRVWVRVNNHTGTAVSHFNATTFSGYLLWKTE